MFSKVLVANRGEIAVRIIAACRDLGLKTVAVFSEADRDAVHVQVADEAVCIGPPDPSQSYLNIPNIISAAEVTGADAIHPGYGFLAENADFAEICESCNIKFIGPTADALRAMGDKAKARELALKARVPVIPGSRSALRDAKEAVKLAKKIGYPVVLKAAAGGGGRGMRIVHHERDLERAFRTAHNEAQRAFGSGELYLEKYLLEPRHVEVQILADEHGRIISCYERECSVQRRHQKIIEEAPCAFISESTRRKLSQAAVKLAKAVRYRNAGTVEFLVDREENFYFIEMNTRIQVEHPVTEWVTGLDLVREQIRIAAGERLTISQKEVAVRGHAVECRINAEDPDTMMPSSGLITSCYFPTFYGCRVDTALRAPGEVPPYYDSLIAKIITWGETRQEAIQRMIRALEMTRIRGIKTNIPLHLAILRDSRFQKGLIHTQYLEEFIRQRAFRRVKLAAS